MTVRTMLYTVAARGPPAEGEGKAGSEPKPGTEDPCQFQKVCRAVTKRWQVG
jgi:hypothetical protein